MPPFQLSLLTQKGSLYVTRPTLATYTATRDDLEATAEELFDVVRSGQVKIEIHHTYKLQNAQQVHGDLGSTPHNRFGRHAALRPNHYFSGRATLNWLTEIQR